MSFFEKHIFFPKRFGIAPYFWLVFLIPTIYSLFPLNSWFDWLFILLLVIFLKGFIGGPRMSAAGIGPVSIDRSQRVKAGAQGPAGP